MSDDIIGKKSTQVLKKTFFKPNLIIFNVNFGTRTTLKYAFL